MCRKNRRGTSFTTIPESLLEEVKGASKKDGVPIRQIFDDAITEMAEAVEIHDFTEWIPGRTPVPGSKPYNVRLGEDVTESMGKVLDKTRVARDTFVVTALTLYMRKRGN